MEQNLLYSLYPREYGTCWRLLRDIRRDRATAHLEDLLPRGTGLTGTVTFTEEQSWSLLPDDFIGGLDRYLELARTYLEREDWRQKDRDAGCQACRELVEMWMGQRPQPKSGVLKPYFDRYSQNKYELEVDDWYRFHQLMMLMEELFELLSDRYADRVGRAYGGDRSKLHRANMFSSPRREYGEELERLFLRLFFLPSRLDQYRQGFRTELFQQMADRSIAQEKARIEQRQQ